MKTRLLALTFILLISAPFIMAQTSDSKAGFGLIGGVNLQSLAGKDYNGDKIDPQLTIGFHAGVNAIIPIAPEFYFQPGLLFTTKGGKSTFAENPVKAAGDDLEITTKLNYIEMPLNLLYRPVLGNGHMLLGFGPYVAYGIGGKENHSGGIMDVDVDYDVKFKSEVANEDSDVYSYYKPFDAGANIFFGYEFSAGIFMQLNAQLGMLKVNPDYVSESNSKTSIKNTGFGVSLGYRF